MTLYKLIGISLASSALCAAYYADRRESGRFDTVVLFGDSYSDVGNTYKLSKGTYPPPHYYNGRFSDGPLWSEYIQELTDAEVLNYAYGGATVNNNVLQGYSGFDSDIAVPSIADQIEMHRDFLANNSNELYGRKFLYVITASGNDYNFGGPTLTPESVATNIYETSKVLFEPPFAGVHFLFTNSAFDHQAFYMQSNVTIQNLALVTRVRHNQHLSNLIRNSGQVNAQIFDMNAFLENELSSSDYEDSSTSCTQSLILRDILPKICKNPEKKVYWDQYHLTTAAHRNLAHAIFEAVFS
ncbi:hypothetical protein K7432_009525 [Basidiobolus ranarum]|uniref:Uncharacterized protein n=1 Tax=Basidiobolus ranarum TaxID=34480 RepID=A0ABR2WQ61_9FUNG